jgi:hypothetical protein
MSDSRPRTDPKPRMTRTDVIDDDAEATRTSGPIRERPGGELPV